MINATTYENIIRNIRQNIITKLNISADRVLNADSVRGPDLKKILSCSDSTSFSLNDLFIVFRLKEYENDSYYIIPEDDNSSSLIISYEFTMNIYGNAAHDASQKLLTIFKEERTLVDLYEQGIYIHQVTKPRFMNEFINNTMWPRCDMSIISEVRILNQNANDVAELDENSISGIIIHKI